MTTFAPIPEILDELRAGRMIVLVDDERRENEGDLVCAAEKITPELVNFMVTEARGYLCLAMEGADCDRLDLTPQATVNTSMRATAFTVTIDAHPRHGITTGVSAAERAKTIRLAIDRSMRTGDFVRPGHINPLRARDGGVLVRTGQTEGSVDLARLAGLYPAAAIIEIMKPDGEMARVPDLEKFCAKHKLKMCSVADIIEWRLSDERMVTRLDPLDGAEIETAEGTFRLFAYRSIVDPLPHIALTVGDVGCRDADGETIPSTEPTLVRMQSRDVLGDVFGVARPGNGTSSGALLRAAMRRVQAEGRGAVVYLRPSMMGGESDALTDRLQTLRLAVDDQVRDDYDQPDLVSATGVGAKAIPVEKRDFGIGGQVLRDLGLTKLRVMTNHPRPMHGLASFGIEIVEHVPLDTADQPVV